LEEWETELAEAGLQLEALAVAILEAVAELGVKGKAVVVEARLEVEMKIFIKKFKFYER
jgi:hypothetical protein